MTDADFKRIKDAPSGIRWVSLDDGATHVAFCGAQAVGGVRRDEFRGGWFWALLGRRGGGHEHRLALAKTELSAAFHHGTKEP